MGDETPRSRAQLEAELASARARLADNLEALIAEVHPKSVAQRRIEDAKQFAANEFYTAKRAAEDQVFDENGELRLRRLAVVGGAVVGVVALLVVVGSATKRRRATRAAR